MYEQYSTGVLYFTAWHTRDRIHVQSKFLKNQYGGAVGKQESFSTSSLFKYFKFTSGIWAKFKIFK